MKPTPRNEINNLKRKVRKKKTLTDPSSWPLPAQPDSEPLRCFLHHNLLPSPKHGPDRCQCPVAEWPASTLCGYSVDQSQRGPMPQCHHLRTPKHEIFSRRKRSSAFRKKKKVKVALNCGKKKRNMSWGNSEKKLTPSPGLRLWCRTPESGWATSWSTSPGLSLCFHRSWGWQTPTGATWALSLRSNWFAMHMFCKLKTGTTSRKEDEGRVNVPLELLRVCVGILKLDTLWGDDEVVVDVGNSILNLKGLHLAEVALKLKENEEEKRKKEKIIKKREKSMNRISMTGWLWRW